MAKKRKLITKAQWKNGTAFLLLPIYAIIALFYYLWLGFVWVVKFLWKWVVIPVYTILKEDVVLPLAEKINARQNKEQEKDISSSSRA